MPLWHAYVLHRLVSCYRVSHPLVTGQVSANIETFLLFALTRWLFSRLICVFDLFSFAFEILLSLTKIFDFAK